MIILTIIETQIPYSLRRLQSQIWKGMQYPKNGGVRKAI
jgi:hypothetical protein